VKTLWREAVRQQRGLSFSSINGFPSELPPGSTFDDVRFEMLEDVHSDERLFDLVRALQSKSHFVFLRDLIIERLGKARPYDRAWAMVVAGFLIPTDEAQALWRDHLAEPPGIGWLGEVYGGARRSFLRAVAMRHWYLRLGEEISEADAWISRRLFQLTVDSRYVDLMQSPPFLFENKDVRVRWLNFFAPEERDARKRAHQALADTWLLGQRYGDVINGR
jgi:hypothetical protein